MAGLLASVAPWVYFVGAIAVLALIIGVLTWLVTRGRGKGPERHFDAGMTPDVDVGNQEIWSRGRTVTVGETIDTVLVPTPEEQTVEIIERETTAFADDLMDPRNPGHAEWERREQERIHRAEQRDNPESSSPT
jgi:hypothetical protein